MHARKENVFYFDATYRPVPLLQRFVGVKDIKAHLKGTRRKKIDIYNELAYEISVAILSHKKQVLIFVHSRKETIMTA